MKSSEVRSSTRENHGLFHMSRRSFLKLSALAGTAVAVSRIIKPQVTGATSHVERKIGEPLPEKWLATSCLNCPTRCATQVRVVDGKAVKVVGNPLSLVSEGQTCPRSHIGLQVLYDSGRVTSPLKRTNPAKGKGVDPQWTPISWRQALNEVSTNLKSLRDRGKPQRLLLLYGLNTISDEDLIRRFADAYGTPNIISGDALEDESERLGRWMADGNYSHIAYELSHTNYILDFSASILESQKPVSRNLRMWGKIRRGRPNRAWVVAIDPRYSVTAAKSDEWIPINPGSEGALAMAIANVIINEGLYDASFIDNWTSGFDEYKKLVLSSYNPERVTAITGIDVDAIRRIAREFAQTKPAIAWVGEGATRWPNGSYNSYAIFCLNALVGSIDIPGGITYQENPKYRDMPKPVEDNTAREGKAQPRIDLRKTSQFPAAEVVTNQVPDSILNASPYPIEMAIGINSNFNMTAPGTWRWDEALSKVSYYVHIAPFVSEMAEYADIVLPASTFLEVWGYDHSPPGSGFAEAKIKQPVVEPLPDSKAIADIVFELARQVGGTVAQSFAHIGDDAQGFVRYRTAPLMPWKEFCEKGVWLGAAYKYHKYDRIFQTPSGKFEFYSGNLEAVLKAAGKGNGNGLSNLPHYESFDFLGDEYKYPLLLLTYQPLLDIENGSQNYPWAQQTYLIMHGIGWTNVAEVNRETAQALGFRDGDMVWVESPFNRIKVKARVIEGIHPGVVSISRGQGHYAYGKWAKGIGVNPNEIVGVDYDHLSGQAAFFNTRVKIYKA